jgi:hypothetical protein
MEVALRKLFSNALLVTVVCFGLIGWAFGAQTVQFNNPDNAVSLLSQNTSSLTMQMEIGSLNLAPVSTTQGQFVMLTVNGFARSQNIGEPGLPMVNRIISIPYGCQLQTEVISSDYQEFDLADYGYNQLVMPAQPSLSKSDDPDYMPFEFKEAVYSRTGYYSLPLVEATEVGTLRAHRLAMVSVAPVAYDPVANKVKVYTNITLRVNYINPDWATTEYEQRRLYSPYFEAVYDRFFNYDDNYPVITDDLVTYPVKYVIVADRMFEAQLEPFVEWKTEKGFQVVEAYTDEIGFTNTAIKAYLEDLYENQSPAPSFVLFVGDDQQIPAFNGSAGSHITDLRFCEFTGDDMPEIYYGRFSAQNPSLLQPQIDKTLEYEQYTMPDPSYLADVTLIAGVDSGHAPTWGNGQINYGTDNYFNAAHGINPNVYLYPHSNDPVEGEIIQEMSDGLGLINYSAHCGHDGFGDPDITSDDLRGLTNAHKYMLGIGNCCLSNTFGSDYSTPCFGEVFLQEANKGGIGYIGGTNSTYWDEDYWWGIGAGPVLANPTFEQMGFGAYDGVFHDHGEPVSQHYITNDALIYCGNLAVMEGGSSMTQYYWEIYTLMGDPSVISYMGVPSTNNITHDPVIVFGSSSFPVHADPGSFVGISMDGVLYGSGYVDESGVVDIDLNTFPSPGTATLVVTSQNRVPYITDLTVITP